jgi:hypothetical protein
LLLIVVVIAIVAVHGDGGLAHLDFFYLGKTIMEAKLDFIAVHLRIAHGMNSGRCVWKLGMK